MSGQSIWYQTGKETHKKRVGKVESCERKTFAQIFVKFNEPQNRARLTVNAMNAPCPSSPPPALPSTFILSVGKSLKIGKQSVKSLKWKWKLKFENVTRWKLLLLLLLWLVVAVVVAGAVTLIVALSTTKLHRMARPVGGHEHDASYKMHGLLKINAMWNIFKCYFFLPGTPYNPLSEVRLKLQRLTERIANDATWIEYFMPALEHKLCTTSLMVHKHDKVFRKRWMESTICRVRNWNWLYLKIHKCLCNISVFIYITWELYLICLTLLVCHLQGICWSCTLH